MITIFFQSIAVNRDLKKKIYFLKKLLSFGQFQPLKPFSRWKKGCKGALSHEKSREGLTSFSEWTVSLENFYGLLFTTNVKNSCLWIYRLRECRCLLSRWLGWEPTTFARVLSVSYFRSGRRVGEDPRGGVGLRTRRILPEKADFKQAIKYSILLLMLVVLELKYNFVCFSQ